MTNRTPMTKALHKAKDLYDDSREVARNGAAQTKSFIQQRPILSTLLGLGAGLLLGHLFRPKE